MLRFYQECTTRACSAAQSDEALDTIVEYASKIVSSFSMVFLQRFHGAYSRVEVYETAYRHRDPSYNLIIFAS